LEHCPAVQIVSKRPTTNLHWTRTRCFAAAKSEVRPAIVVKISLQLACKCCRHSLGARVLFLLASFLVCLLASWLATVQPDGRQKCRPLGANIESDGGQMFAPLLPDDCRQNSADDDYNELLRASCNATGWSCQLQGASLERWIGSGSTRASNKQPHSSPALGPKVPPRPAGHPFLPLSPFRPPFASRR